jgi:hypothetical protein
MVLINIERFPLLSLTFAFTVTYFVTFDVAYGAWMYRLARLGIMRKLLEAFGKLRVSEKDLI